MTEEEIETALQEINDFKPVRISKAQIYQIFNRLRSVVIMVERHDEFYTVTRYSPFNVRLN